jgi:hypothetical protein
MVSFHKRLDDPTIDDQIDKKESNYPEEQTQEWFLVLSLSFKS